MGALSAGSSPRRATYFSCSHKKSRQKKCAPLAVSLRFAAGNLRCSCAGRRCRTRFVRFALAAQTAAASQFTKRACCAARPPHALRFSARPEGGLKAIRAIAALGLVFFNAAAARGCPGSLSLWERVGVRAIQLKNHSCPRTLLLGFRLLFSETQADQAQAAIKKQPALPLLTGRVACAASERLTAPPQPSVPPPCPCAPM